MVCPRCETANHPVDECPERNEAYHGVPSDNVNDADDDGVRCWVQAIDETWHASMYFEGTRHVGACGEILETPVAGVKEDPRFVDETHTCEDCEAYLEADDDETVPDGGEFATASELRADGGLEEVFRRETITEAADGGLQVGEREVVDRDSSAWWYVESENKRDGGEE